MPTWGMAIASSHSAPTKGDGQAEIYLFNHPGYEHDSNGRTVARISILAWHGNYVDRDERDVTMPSHYNRGLDLRRPHRLYVDSTVVCSLFNIVHLSVRTEWDIKVTSSSAIAETALQGGLVMTKSVRLELGDNILRRL